MKAVNTLTTDGWATCSSEHFVEKPLTAAGEVGETANQRERRADTETWWCNTWLRRVAEKPGDTSAFFEAGRPSRRAAARRSLRRRGSPSAALTAAPRPARRLRGGPRRCARRLRLAGAAPRFPRPSEPASTGAGRLCPREAAKEPAAAGAVLSARGLCGPDGYLRNVRGGGCPGVREVWETTFRSRFRCLSRVISGEPNISL